jgi:HD-like signal output (HDOD) protein
VLKNINTGFYHIGKKVTSIREAVVYLGMQTVQNIIIFYITRQLFSEILHEKKNRLFSMKLYWKHVIGTSVASSILSEKIKRGDKFKLFTYGLLHDIGIALLDACLPGLVDEIAKGLLSGTHQVVAERSVLGGITHADVGAWLCRKWNIRDDIINIVEHHHTPFWARSSIEDVRIIYAADVISTEYYERLLGLNLNHDINRKIMDYLGISDDDRLKIIEALPQEVDKLHWLFTE